MNFRPELAQAILDGRKTETRRLLSDNPNSPWWKKGCAYKVGRDYAVCPGRGKEQVGRLRVLEVVKGRMGEVGTIEARREGFTGLQHFRETWKQLHDDFDPDLKVWVVRFERFHRYTVVEPGRYGTNFHYRYQADDLEQVREILDGLSAGQARRCWVIDNRDPSGFGRVALEEIP